MNKGDTVWVRASQVGEPVFEKTKVVRVLSECDGRSEGYVDLTNGTYPMNLVLDHEPQPVVKVDVLGSFTRWE